jgi:hypothetical protein
MTSIKKNIAGGKYVGLGIAIGGHSHGANVARVAAKDVYSELNQMVQAGTLDKIPPINLVMVNAPILNDKAYEFSANELLYINTIQVDSKVDIVAGAGQELIGIFGTNEFYSDTAHKIEYEDQLKFDWIGCGVSNHCGHADENVKVWYPKVDKELK